MTGTIATASRTRHDDGIARDGATPTQRATILYATDPICSHCWAMEPGWRRLLHHYGDRIELRHVYGGLLPGWEGFRDLGAGIAAPADVAPHWDEVVDRYGQPIDSSVWLSDPLDSSYPASVATHAVRRLAPDREEAYLRRIREALFLEARNIARSDVLADCAVDVGLDRDRFLAELESPEARAAFDADRALLPTLGIRGFPTLVVEGPALEKPWVMRGTQPYHRLEKALRAALGELPAPRAVDAAAVLASYGSGTTRELAEVMEMDEGEAGRALAAAGARRTEIAGSVLWTAP